ncbi:MAG: hypothetical protein ACKO3P_22185, partial [Planctomycetaceae bacterium]
MNIRFRCPRCDTVASLSRLDGNVIACPGCDWSRPLPAKFQSSQRPSEWKGSGSPPGGGPGRKETVPKIISFRGG